jgi:hypothetical protein
MPNLQSCVLTTIMPAPIIRRRSPIRFIEMDMPIGARSMEIRKRSTGETFVLINSKLSAGGRAAIRRERSRRS